MYLCGAGTTVQLYSSSTAVHPGTTCGTTQVVPVYLVLKNKKNQEPGPAQLFEPPTTHLLWPHMYSMLPPRHANPWDRQN